MKKCPKCKKEYSNGEKKCTSCDEILIELNNINKTFYIEESKIKEKENNEDNKNPLSVYYYFGIIFLIIVSYISYQVGSIFGMLLFPTLAIILFSKTKPKEETKVKPHELIVTMVIVFIILIIVFFWGFIFYLPFNFPD